MIFNVFVGDKNGQAFSIDAMLAIIVITVIIGISANAMDLVSYKIQDYSSEHSFERITGDTADVLITTPGSPSDWEKYSSLTGSVTPGLAEWDVETCRTVPNTLSIRKVFCLKENYEDLMDKILPKGADSNMMVYPMDSKLSPIVIHDKTPSTDSAQVAVVNRTVLCDYMYITASVSMNSHKNPSWGHQSGQDWEICTHSGLTGSLKHETPDFDSGKPGWACHHFNITQYDLNFTDFYVMSDSPRLGDDSARWIIDKPDNMTDDEQKFSSTPIPVNNRISQLLGDHKIAVLWFHVRTHGNPGESFNAYVVGVPKGTSSDQVKLEYLNPQPASFVLKVWM